MPTGVRMMVMSLAEMVLLGLVNGYGSEATAAYGAVNQVMGYMQFTGDIDCHAASILGAQAIGSGQTQPTRRHRRTGLLMNLVLTGGLVRSSTFLAR